MPKKHIQDKIIKEGMNTLVPEELTQITKLENIRLDKYGVPSKFHGYIAWNSDIGSVITDSYEFKRTDDSRNLLAIEGTNFKFSTGDASFTAVTTHGYNGASPALDNTVLYDFSTARNRAYFCNELQHYSTDLTKVRPMGCNPPSGAPTHTLSAGSLTGTFYYKVSYLYDDFQESTVSVASLVASPSTQQIDLASIPTGPANAGVTDRKIYRTKTGSASTGAYFLVATISDNTTTTYTDNKADADLTDSPKLDVLPLTHQASGFGSWINSPGHVEWHSNRMWIADTGNDRIYVSDVLAPDVVRELNFLNIDPADGESITGIQGFRDELLVFKPSKIYVIRGTHSGSLSNMIVERLSNAIGCIHHGTIKSTEINRTTAVVFGDRNGLYAYTGSYPELLSGPIENRWKAFAQTSAATNGKYDVDSALDWTTLITNSPSTGDNSSAVVSGETGSVSDPVVRYNTETLWDTGTFSNSTYFLSNSDNTISLDTTTFEQLSWNLEDSFDDGTLTWTRVNGTVDETTESGRMVVYNNGSGDGRAYVASTNVDCFKFNLQNIPTLSGSTDRVEIHFMSTTSDAWNHTGTSYYLLFNGGVLSLYKQVSGNHSKMITAGTAYSTSPSSSTEYSVTRSQKGVFKLYISGVLQGTSSADTTLTTSSYVSVSAEDSGATVEFDDWYTASSTLSRTWTSPEISTGTDMTSWDNFAETSTANDGTVSYTFESAATSPATQGTPDAITNGTDPTSLANTTDSNFFGQLVITMTCDFGDTSPSISTASVSWLTTTTVESDVIFMSDPAPDGWSVFSSNIEAAGEGITFKLRTFPTSTPANSYTTVTNGLNPSAVSLDKRAQLLIVMQASDGVVPKVDDFILKWFTGAQPTNGMVVTASRGLIYVSAMTNNESTVNDISYVMDSSGRWITLDFGMQTLLEYFEDIFFSDTTTGEGVFFRMDEDIFTRAGSSYTSTIETGNLPWVEEGLSDQRKKLRSIWMNINSSESFGVSAQPDEGTFTTPKTVTGGRSVYVPINSDGYRHKIRITHSGTVDFKLWKMSPEIHIYPRRKGQ